MSPVTHFLSGWVLGAATSGTRRDRVAITVATVAPDIDGLGAIAELLTRNTAHPLLWFSQYHHVLHNLFFAVVISAAVALLAVRRWKTALLAFLAFHVHLFCDVLGSRGPDGYDWPIPYLLPFSNWQWGWQGQWPLNGWQNVLITLFLLTASLLIAIRVGHSPVEAFSVRADRVVVSVLRRWFSPDSSRGVMR